MENRGLLFIPDISGFTRFVNEIEIEHSKNIIQELLELLINANQIGLEVSEIEGDAILFYKFGDAPDLKQIYGQVEKMFRAFHRQLGAYEIRRYCQCKACVSAINLSLKVITHYGEFTQYTVKNFRKLIGKDIIVAHQLLKNDIPQHEYWLVTDGLLRDSKPNDFTDWMQWMESTKHIESGEISFHYTQIGQLKHEIEPEPVLDLDIRDKVKVVSASREYPAHIITLFHATGDFNYRGKWMDGVESVEEVGHFLPRVGMHCRCKMKNGEVMLYSSSYAFNSARVEFSETDEKKSYSYHYILEKLDDTKTRVTLEYFIRKNLLEQTLFNLTRKHKMEISFQKSLTNLESFVKELKVPIVDI